MNFTPYLHNCNAGDLIGALAGIRQIRRDTGQKGLIYQLLDVPGHYYEGAIHSVKDEKGTQVTMNRKMFDMLRPLVVSLDYIEDFQVYTGQEKYVDLTRIRHKKGSNIPYCALPGWTFHAFPDMACDLSEPWIEVEEFTVIPGMNPPFPEMILINRTERYLNPRINYSFLKPFENYLVFTGTQFEHRKFAKDSGLDISYLEMDNFLELAQAIKSCRFFMGNQSFPWNLANAMGKPRILEMCEFAPNCEPFFGKDNLGFLNQQELEYYFELLFKKTAAKAAVEQETVGKSMR